MTTTNQKLLAFLNQSESKSYDHINSHNWDTLQRALAHTFEEHENYKQTASKIVSAYINADGGISDWDNLKTLIIPAPKPDPLVEVLKDLSWDEETTAEEWAVDLRAALEARGLKIREKNDD